MLVKNLERHTLQPHFWVENYADYLYSFAIVRLSDPDLSADLVQETYLSALKAKEQFKGDSSEKTWLTSILKRKIIDVYRKRSASKEIYLNDYKSGIIDEAQFSYDGPFEGHWKEAKGPGSYSLLPEGELEKKELREILERCISRLPENLASVFIMKMIDEASSEEICKELDITTSNVWVIMHRARLKLRECIEFNWR